MFDQPRAAGVLMLLVLATAASPVQAQQAVAVAASPATVQIQTPASDQVPPLPNRLNDVLPSWLRLRGEYRMRAERADNTGFREDGDDSFAVSRVRVNATASLT